jgi:hypothetical protein
MNTKEKRPASRQPSSKRRSAPSAQRAKEAAGKTRQRDGAGGRSRTSAVKQREPARRSAQATRQNPAAAAKQRRPVRRPVNQQAKRAESQVVYTPPKPFNKFHLLLTMISVAAIVLALTLGMSIFFKVENVYIAGAEKYSAWDIREASGIQVGDNLLTLGKAKVSGKIIARLPYVEKVRIGIKLPDTVNIEIVESDISYAIQAEDNGWWFINSQGRVLEMTTGIIAEYFTRIEGVKIMIPAIGQQAIAATAEVDVPFEPDDDTTESTETTDVTQPPTAPMDTVNAAEQLATVIKLIQHLQSNGVVGEVTKINVTDLFNMELIYEDRYRVQLGDTSQMDRKVRSMMEAIAQMSDYQRGELDVSFTIWPDRAGYTPLQNDEEL